MCAEPKPSGVSSHQAVPRLACLTGDTHFSSLSSHISLAEGDSWTYSGMAAKLHPLFPTLTAVGAGQKQRISLMLQPLYPSESKTQGAIQLLECLPSWV